MGKDGNHPLLSYLTVSPRAKWSKSAWLSLGAGVLGVPAALWAGSLVDRAISHSFAASVSINTVAFFLPLVVALCAGGAAIIDIFYCGDRLRGVWVALLGMVVSASWLGVGCLAFLRAFPHL